MLYNERVKLIMENSKKKSVVKVNDLAEELNVSVDTVRRDLKSMEEQGLLKCVRGGAYFLEYDMAVSTFINRDVINVEKKFQAAKKAVKNIKNGDVITMNSGTTNRIIAEEIVKNDFDITVITNNIAAINILMQKPSIKVIVPGGFLDSTEKSIFGGACEHEFEKYNPDICFLSINAVDLSKGYSDFRLKEIDLIKIMAQNSKKTIAVMDSSKFDKISKQTVFPLNCVDLLVTDDKLSKEVFDKYSKNDINII